MARIELKDLGQFNGSDFYYSTLIPGIKSSQGAHYVAENYGAHWLIDKIVTNQINPKIKGQEFQVWNLMVKGNKAVLECSDGNDVILHKERISVTDFPEPGIKMYYSNRVVFLPSEY